jgi:PAS domain S-box-containing protein
MFGRRVDFRPFAARGRRTVGAILVIFTLFSGLSLFLSVSTTTGAKHRAAIVQVAARQRTLAERYAKNVLLAREGAEADPGAIARVLAASAAVLLDGGIAPSVDGDDDETRVPRESGAIARSQLKQEQRLVRDLVATGSALLAHRTRPVRLTAGEHLSRALPPTERLTVLTGLTSNVSLNVARTIGLAEDTQLNKLMTEQIVLSALGLLVFGVLSWALVTSTRRQSAHFRSLVTSTTDLVLAFSEARCRYASRSVLQMLGRTEPELLDAGFVDFVHPGDRAGFLQALAGNTTPTIAFRLPGHDGGWRDLEAHVTDLRGDRHVRCVVLNARDVTERNRADAERESVLVQEKLANDTLRELDVMKDEFVALVSHELRTPLTTIKGYTELVLDGTAGELNDEQRMMLAAVDRSSARLFRLINDLLFVAQVNAGKLSVALEDVDLAAVARESIEDARPRAAAAEVSLEFESTSTPTVKADPVRLGQVFDNLISNAIKFTPAGGRVGLTIEMVGAEAIVVVTDSGMGMSAEDQQRLFTRFFRTKAAGKIQGTGLGLSITKAIVDAHNGSISVESAVGSGTSFTFTVPTSDDVSEEHGMRSPAAPLAPVG